MHQQTNKKGRDKMERIKEPSPVHDGLSVGVSTSNKHQNRQTKDTCMLIH